MHVTFHFQIEFLMHCLLNGSVYFVYYKTVLDTHQMRLVIVLFGLISLRFKIQSLSLLWSSCENFRPLAEAKCHTVWKMIVYSVVIYVIMAVKLIHLRYTTLSHGGLWAVISPFNMAQCEEICAFNEIQNNVNNM